MKSRSRDTLSIIGLAVLLAFGAAVAAQAQNREKYIISATAGGINYVSGNVTVQRKGHSSQTELTASDNLHSGDKVTTGAGGRVEVLLNPGSYLRVDENSEFELADASLDNLLVKLINGSALVEATSADGVQLAIGINTPQTEAMIIRGGIYRFNVLPNATTEILVRKGRVILVRGAATEIKGGQKVLIGRGILEVAKLDKKNQDSFDLWSKERAETLARANRRLQSRPLLTAFNDFGWNDLYSWSWSSRHSNLGLWVYNPGTHSHCFVPLGYRSWSSPYGHHYGTGIGFNGNNWPQGYNPQTAGNGPSSGNGSTGSTGGNGGWTNNPPPSQPTYTPPPPPASPPPSPPPSDSGVERGPRRDYTTQSPN